MSVVREKETVTSGPVGGSASFQILRRKGGEEMMIKAVLELALVLLKVLREALGLAFDMNKNLRRPKR